MLCLMYLLQDQTKNCNKSSINEPLQHFNYIYREFPLGLVLHCRKWGLNMFPITVFIISSTITTVTMNANAHVMKSLYPTCPCFHTSSVEIGAIASRQRGLSIILRTWKRVAVLGKFMCSPSILTLYKIAPKAR